MVASGKHVMGLVSRAEVMASGVKPHGHGSYHPRNSMPGRRCLAGMPHVETVPYPLLHGHAAGTVGCCVVQASHALGAAAARQPERLAPA